MSNKILIKRGLFTNLSNAGVVDWELKNVTDKKIYFYSGTLTFSYMYWTVSEGALVREGSLITFKNSGTYNTWCKRKFWELL